MRAGHVVSLAREVARRGNRQRDGAVLAARAAHGNRELRLSLGDVAGHDDVEEVLPCLEEALGLKPEGAIDDYGIPARLIPFFESTPAFSTLPEDTVFAVRRVSTMSAFTGKDKEEKAHARHVAFARALIAYVPEETEQTAE